jgi:hypothetical protein
VQAFDILLYARQRRTIALSLQHHLHATADATQSQTRERTKTLARRPSSLEGPFLRLQVNEQVGAPSMSKHPPHRCAQLDSEPVGHEDHPTACRAAFPSQLFGSRRQKPSTANFKPFAPIATNVAHGDYPGDFPSFLPELAGECYSTLFPGDCKSLRETVCLKVSFLITACITKSGRF